MLDGLFKDLIMLNLYKLSKKVKKLGTTNSNIAFLFYYEKNKIIIIPSQI